MTMKKIFLLLIISCTVPLSAKELKVLMIGNSFSQSVLKYLPKISTVITAASIITSISVYKRERNIFLKKPTL